MIQKKANTYFEGQVGIIGTNIQIADMSHSSELVHDLRVAIKKIRTFLNVFNLQKNKRIKKLLKRNIDVIFKKAGNLRNSQVYYELVQDYENLLKKEFYDLKEYLLVKIERRRKSMHKILPKKSNDFLNVLRSEVSENLETITNDKLKKRVGKYLDTSIKKFEKNKNYLDSRDLHKQRKILKEIRFCYEISASINPEEFPDELITKIRELEDILGRWHDYNRLKQTIEMFVLRLRKSKVDQVIKLNTLSDTISNDIVILLDNYHKIIPDLDLNKQKLPFEVPSL